MGREEELVEIKGREGSRGREREQKKSRQRFSGLVSFSGSR
jgi:hypothetical protein